MGMNHQANAMILLLETEEAVFYSSFMFQQKTWGFDFKKLINDFGIISQI